MPAFVEVSHLFVICRMIPLSQSGFEFRLPAGKIEAVKAQAS